MGNIFSSEPEILEKQIQKNMWFYSYIHRNLQSIFKKEKLSPSFSIVYIDNEGYILDIFGPDSFLEVLKKDEIQKGVNFLQSDIGNNAVTFGLLSEASCKSIGDENEHPVLKKYAIYFAPLFIRQIVRGKFNETIPRNFGGIAIFSEELQENLEYPLLLSALVHDIVMTLHFNQHAVRLYEQTGNGIIIVDMKMHTDTPPVIYLNERFCEIFGIEMLYPFFFPVIDLLPREENKEFYHLLEDLIEVKDRPISLTVRGKSIYCILTTLAYDQPVIDAKGLICFITTPQIEAEKISKKTANSAVLSFPDIIGSSPATRSAIRRAQLIANTDSNVIILGESGTGKDVFAQAIHNASRRRNKPFVAVNCGALPRDLIESELFGYDSGAFTGAKRNGNIGKFELANGGTIFLDEIGELPIGLQATLLRVVETKQLMRLGSNRLIDVDVKIISATNANLTTMIEQRLFRSDLFFRLSTMKISLPPLRNRDNDILLLAEHFASVQSRRIGRTKPTFSEDAKQLLMALSWPGNIRELQNLIECILQLYPENVITSDHILENITLSSADELKIQERRIIVPQSPLYPLKSEAPGTESIPSSASFASVPARHTDTAIVSKSPSSAAKSGPVKKRRKITPEDIVNALEACGYNRSKAAEILGISRKTLYRKMDEFEMK